MLEAAAKAKMEDPLRISFVHGVRAIYPAKNAPNSPSVTHGQSTDTLPRGSPGELNPYKLQDHHEAEEAEENSCRDVCHGDWEE